MRLNRDDWTQAIVAWVLVVALLYVMHRLGWHYGWHRDH